MKVYTYFSAYALFLVLLGYFIPREEFLLTFFLFGLCTLLYGLIFLDIKTRDFSFKEGLLIALFLRLTLFLSLPVLSDDYYRYIFDGQLVNQGLNPYLLTPTELVKSGMIQINDYWLLLYGKMNSPEYFSIYPPLHQLFFFVAALGGENLLFNVILLRIFILGLDFLNMFLLYKILMLLNQPISKTWLYAFNPLIILELTGNLHFEGLILTGLLGTVFFWIKKKPEFSALGWSWAIGIKLTPLMLGPWLVLSWQNGKILPFLGFSALFIGVLFTPLFYFSGIQNFWCSIRLFQSTFEFNASVYYIIKWLSGFFIDYNPIAYVGPMLNFAAFLAIVFYCAKHKGQDIEKLLIGIVHIYLIYLLSQNVVHPWYIIPAFGISILTKSKVFLVWTGLVFLSYNAYSNPEVKENACLIMIEYGVLFIFILKEIQLKMGKPKSKI